MIRSFNKDSLNFPPSEACLEMALGERIWQHLIDKSGSAWWQRLHGVNQQLLSAYGLPLPSLRLDQDLDLSPYSYRFRLAGGAWESGNIFPGRWFATGDPATVALLMGEMGQEPVYGLEGRWIPESRGAGAQALGCHLLAAEALWVGHICDRLESRLHLCLSHQWLKQRLKFLGIASPGKGFFQVLCWLLEERVSIACLELLADTYRSSTGDLSHRLRNLRQALGARLTSPWLNEDQQLITLSLSESTSRKLREQLSWSDGPDQWFLSLLLTQIHNELELASREHHHIALLVPSPVRRALFELLPFELRHTPVLAFDEVAADIPLQSVAEIGSRLHPLAQAWPSIRLTLSSQ